MKRVRNTLWWLWDLGIKIEQGVIQDFEVGGGNKVAREATYRSGDMLPPTPMFGYSEVDSRSGGFWGCLFVLEWGQILRVSKLGLWVYVHESTKHALIYVLDRMEWEWQWQCYFCPCMITVEPPNKGHFGSRHFVLYREAVLWWEVK